MSIIENSEDKAKMIDIYKLLDYIVKSDLPNWITILTGVGTFLSIIAKIFKKLNETREFKGKKIRLGSDLMVCDWGSYLCLLLAPIINLVIYFISLLIMYGEYWVIVSNISHNKVRVLVLIFLICVVSEILMIVAVNGDIKLLSNTLWKKIILFVWNFGIVCMFSAICGYLYVLGRNEIESLDVIFSVIPIYIFLILGLFYKIYWRNTIDSNRCIEWNARIGVGSISIYVGIFLFKIPYLADAIGIIWIVSIIIHILLHSYCWLNMEGTVYLNENGKKTLFWYLVV